MKGSEWGVVEFLATGLSVFSIGICITSKNMTQDGNQKGVGDISGYKICTEHPHHDK